MSLFNTVQVAVKALLRNPTRALLTTLGIVIGIAAVITMMEQLYPQIHRGNGREYPGYYSGYAA